MKKQKSKKNGIIAAVITLSSISLVSVGFASWIISGGVEANVGGTITAEQAVDQRFLVKAYEGESGIYNDNGAIKFGSAIYFGHKTPETAPAHEWLKISAADKNKQNLEAVTKFWVANLPEDADESGNLIKGTVDGVANSNVLKIDQIAVQGAAATVFNTTTRAQLDDEAETPTQKRLFADAPTPVLEIQTGTGSTTSFENVSYTLVKATVTFNWGAYFDSKNPFEYFNGKTYSKEWGDEALKVLNIVYSLNDASYKTTIHTGSYAA